MRTLLILIIGSLVFGNCASDSSEATVRSAEVANPSPFGDLEGRMSWADAKKKCESKKMGLPTSDDFKNAVKMNYNASWTEKEQNYWTSEEVKGNKLYKDGEGAHSFSLDGAPKVLTSTKNGKLYVRCIKKDM